MALPEEYVRIIIKNSSVANQQPTVPTDDTDLDSFISTDIFDGELFYNIEDEVLYTRSGNNIVNLNNVCNPLVDSTSTDITLSNATIYEVTGTSSVELTLPIEGKYTVKKMESGGTVSFSEQIDGSTFSLVNQNESVTTAYDGSDWIIIDYYDPGTAI